MKSYFVLDPAKPLVVVLLSCSSKIIQSWTGQNKKVLLLNIQNCLQIKLLF